MINSVIIEGNVVRDPELRFLTTGTAVCEVSIANTQRFTTGGERRESTSFVGLVLFGATAESFAKWQRKGSRVIVEGELTQQTWEDKTTGQKREKTKVKVSKWHFSGSKREGQQESAPPAASSTWDLPPAPPAPSAPASPAPILSNFASATLHDDASPIDDDVPF